MKELMYVGIPKLVAKAEDPGLRGKMAGYEWAHLLTARPEFAERCNWDSLSGGDWVGLLMERPEFATRCPWEKVRGADWWNLLEFQPQFVDACDWPWEKAPGDLLAEMFKHTRDRAMIEEHCPWDRFTGDQWSWFLFSCGAGFAERLGDKVRWDKLDSEDWEMLFGTDCLEYAFRCPHDKVNVSKYTRTALAEVNILLAREEAESEDVVPTIRSVLDDFESLERRYLGDVGSLIRRLEEEGRDALASWEWAKLVEARPEFADRCDWGRFDGTDWARLLAARPEFADRCDWGKLSKWDWSYLVFSRPDKASSFPLRMEAAREVTEAARPLYDLDVKKK
jgi:hypothetical protein